MILHVLMQIKCRKTYQVKKTNGINNNKDNFVKIFDPIFQFKYVLSVP